MDLRGAFSLPLVAALALSVSVCLYAFSSFGGCLLRRPSSVRFSSSAERAHLASAVFRSPFMQLWRPPHRWEDATLLKKRSRTKPVKFLRMQADFV